MTINPRRPAPPLAFSLTGGMIMRRVFSLLLALAISSPAQAQSSWRVEILPSPGGVTAVEHSGAEVRIAVGRGWYRLDPGAARLESAAMPPRPALPQGALPDSRVAVAGDRRVWLAGPTDRYRHGVLGDAVEAGSLVIARSDGSRRTLRLGADAVLEDLAPRIASIGGAERIVVVKSYLDRGSALAVIDANTAGIVAETPPVGRPHAWLNPAGIADFDGDGAIDIAIVRQPHVVGRLEVWSWREGGLKKSAELPDVSNHVIGSRVLGMSAVADFDGDGRADLALPSLDRRALRLIGFGPQPRDIARVPLPARIVTNIAVARIGGHPVLVMGLENGALALVRR